MEEQQGSSKGSKTDGTPEADALKISRGDPPPNADIHTATLLNDEVLEASTQEVTGEEEEDVADDQEDISRDPDQDIETWKAPGSTEDSKSSSPQDKKE